MITLQDCLMIENSLPIGVEIHCSNGTLERISEDVTEYSQSMLSDCTSCQHCIDHLVLYCKVNPTYTGKDLCEHYKES